MRCVTGQMDVPKISVPTSQPNAKTKTSAPTRITRNARVTAISRHARAATANVCRTCAAGENERPSAGACDNRSALGGPCARSPAPSAVEGSTTARRRHQRRRPAPPWCAKRKRATSSAKTPHGDGDPQRAIPEQDVRPPDEPRVALGRRPVLCRQRHRAAAERVDKRGQHAVCETIGESTSDQAEHEQRDAAEIRRQRLTSERRGGEHERADHDEVREQHEQVGLHVRERAAPGRTSPPTCTASPTRAAARAGRRAAAPRSLRSPPRNRPAR